MSINSLFLIIGGALLGAAAGLFFAHVKHDVAFMDKPLLHLAITACVGFGIGCMILAVVVRECPSCNIIVKSNYCEVCGQQVREDLYPQKLYCFECGADIKVETNYCPRCGKSVNENIMLLCPECGTECDTPFCGQCGTPMNPEG